MFGGVLVTRYHWHKWVITTTPRRCSRASAVPIALEVVENDVGGTYRAVYTVKFVEAVFVLHCFQKKSKSGVATPKVDIDIIHARLKVAEAFVQELRNAKANH
jgi:phage-related protein